MVRGVAIGKCVVDQQVASAVLKAEHTHTTPVANYMCVYMSTRLNDMTLVTMNIYVCIFVR